MSDLIKTDRIETLKNRMLSLPRYASIEQAKLLQTHTKSMRENQELCREHIHLKMLLRK